MGNNIINSAFSSRFGLTCRWDTDPLFFSDVKLNRSHILWSTENELISALKRADRHVYLLCARYPAILAKVLPQIQIGCALTPVLFYGDDLIVGPLMMPTTEHQVNADVLDRLCARRPSLRERIERFHELLWAKDPQFDPWLTTIRTLWEVRLPRVTPRNLLVINLATGDVTRETPLLFSKVSPPLSHQDFGSTPISDIIGRHSGLIGGLGKPKFQLDGFSVISSAVSKGGPWRHAAGAGISPQDGIARQKALFETIERACALRGAANSVLAKQKDLVNSPPINLLRPYSAKQYAKSGFPFVPVNEADELVWVEGKRLTTADSIFLPAAFVTLDPRCSSPAIAPLSSNGIAAGASVQHASRAAIAELAERDLVLRSLAKGALQKLNSQEWVPGPLAKLNRQGLELLLASCDERSDAVVVLAFVFDPDTRTGSYGTALAADFIGAALSATEEAVLMWSYRNENKCLLPMAQFWDQITPCNSESAMRTTVWQSLIAHYDPVVCQLTMPEAYRVGVCVAGAWSAKAIFPASSVEYLPANIDGASGVIPFVSEEMLQILGGDSHG